MKIYKKPTLEVISMKSSENIANNSVIKTMYVKAAKNDGYVVSTDGLEAYDPYADMNGSATPTLTNVQ